MKIAQLRHDESGRTWTLYWADRNQRWYRYWNLDPATTIGPLLDEIDEDPSCIFFGGAAKPERAEEAVRALVAAARAIWD